MVEQILLFAAIREGQQRYRSTPTRSVPDSGCVAASPGDGWGLHSKPLRFHSGTAHQKPNLPAHSSAISPALFLICVQNLITNALKYGGEKKWIEIQAHLYRTWAGTEEFRSASPIAAWELLPEELRHIFEPFYRSPSGDGGADPRHGTGTAAGEEYRGSDERPSDGEKRSRTRQHIYPASALLRIPSRQTEAKDAEVVSS